jgi:hypothetical protein
VAPLFGTTAVSDDTVRTLAAPATSPGFAIPPKRLAVKPG